MSSQFVVHGDMYLDLGSYNNPVVEEDRQQFEQGLLLYPFRGFFFFLKPFLFFSAPDWISGHVVETTAPEDCANVVGPY